VNIESVIERMNLMGSRSEAFFFMIDFEMKQPVLVPLADAINQGIYFDIPICSNIINKQISNKSLELNSFPVSFQEYQKSYNQIHKGIEYGDSFLANLCFVTPIVCNLSLEEIFYRTRSMFRLLYRNQFVVFSPERFVRIDKGKLWSYPMKGTIDALLPDAAERILADPKEAAEHNTIVDLIRNDVGRVSESVTLTRFRYLDRIETNKGALLQVSSEICGELPSNYMNHLGDIIMQMLPAGSISGAPKTRTLELIRSAENFDREYFTGVFGVFDGKQLDSAVMIRFIEKTDKGLVFKSGGGITINSEAKSEYEEMIQKVYVPII
jgi:para-aminobenzoate synthetase component 1